MAYATVEELAAALRITVTPANQATLQSCLDAAAIEINDAVDWPLEVQPLIADQDPPNPLLNRTNILRGVEWWKANDAAFGLIGVSETGSLQAPRNTMRRHAITLLPLKQQWGVG
jgi:hypothetical protein